MWMNKFKILIVTFFILMLIPIQSRAAAVWTGNGVYYADKKGTDWGISADQIAKYSGGAKILSISDIASYSAYVSDSAEKIGKTIDKSIFWFNKSRLAYVKLLKVTPGQDISFLFSEERYVYCAEFNSKYVMVRDGSWITTGDRFSLSDTTSWIMLVFRNPNGNLSDAAGLDTTIKVSDISNMKYKYIIFQPFIYTFDLNGGTYKNNTTSFKMERLGVEKMALPVPVRSGYVFGGWKGSDGSIYNNYLDVQYKQLLFADAAFKAVWNEIEPDDITLNKNYVILEENSDETVSLKASVLPSGTLNKSITWSSDNTSIAAVNSNGVVTAKKSGVATIRATASNGKYAECKIYVMGFDVILPDYCSLNEGYTIKINVYNNGVKGMSGRKKVIIGVDGNIKVNRIGDKNTSYQILAESSADYNQQYIPVSSPMSIAETSDTTTIYYRLVPSEEIKKTGDYEGSIAFTVTVK